MSNFLIFKAAFNNSATPAIGTYTAEGATAQFNRNTSISPDYYLYNTVLYSAVQWFVPTAETTDFEFVADILTRSWDNRLTYFIIADSAGTTRLRMWSVNDNWHFENSDSINTSGTEYIGTIRPSTSGGFGVFHQFRVRVRKLTASSSSVEVYVDGTLRLTATAGAALITCAKIGFVGGVNSFGPGTGAGIKNAYVYDLSGGEVIDRGVLSGAFNRFISWMKSVFALKSDIPTVNNGTLTIQKNGSNVATFTANQSTAATANITVPVNTSDLVNDSGYLTASSNLDASKLTSGTVDIARLPQGALERLVKVANEAARYALTTADVQLGDTVQQLDTGIMYIVTDADHLDSAAGYTEYTAGTAASVPWSGVTGKPTFAAVATSGAYSDLTGTPALAAVATSGAYSDLTGTPTIPTVNNATLTIQRNGTTIDTFTANASVDKTININTADDTKIPLAGSNAISGSLIPEANDTVNLGSLNNNYKNIYCRVLSSGNDTSRYMTIYAGDDIWGSGGALVLYAKDCTLDGMSGGEFVLGAVDGTDWKRLIGSPSGTLTWGGQPIQIASDQRLKQQITEIDDKLLDAWEDVDLVQFKYNDAVKEKSDNARLHTGYVVQQIDSACKSHNVDVSAYGLYCHEEYPQEVEEVEVEQTDGTKVKEKKVIREASEHYSLRYTEVYAVECMYLRRCIARLTARIEQLEKEQEASK